jgi:chemotaxis protein CheD
MAATPTAPLSAPPLVVGVGDMAVSDDAGRVLSTYALGSCVGLVAYEPYLKVGGILHLMLPDSTISPAKAAANPAMFADTGLPQFFLLLASFQARAPRLQLVIAGGANVILGHDPFCIGERNVRATVDFLTRNGLTARRAEVGGSVNRTLHLVLGTGLVTIKSPTAEDLVLLTA